jgi:phasin family protein
MKATTDQFASTNKATLDTLTTIAQTALASTERFTALNLNTARAAMEDMSANIGALLQAKDPQQLMTMQTSMAQPTFEKIFAYSRGVYEIASEAQGEMTKLVQSQFSAMNKNMTSAIDQASKNAPAGSEVAVSAVKSAIAAANSAFDSMSAAAKQVTEMAEANVAAATNATVKAVGAATGKKAA